MPDETTPPPPAVETIPDPTAMPHMGEEYGTAAKNLPPLKIVLISLAVVVIFAAVFALIQRPQAAASGTIDNISVVEIPTQTQVLVAISVTIHNNGKKPFWIRGLQADVITDAGTQSDQAASAVDAQRYLQAFPALRPSAYAPVEREGMIGPGAEQKGTMVFSFPMTADSFNARKSIKITIQPYDEPLPLVLTK